jgi:hypothetical protein
MTQIFGLTAREMQNYQGLTQIFCSDTVKPDIIRQAEFICDFSVDRKGKKTLNKEFLQEMVFTISLVVERIITQMAYEYAYLRYSDMDEMKIIHYLHEKYTEQLPVDMMDYGIASHAEMANHVVGLTILELPHLYLEMFEDPDKYAKLSETQEKNEEAYELYVESAFEDFESTDSISESIEDEEDEVEHSADAKVNEFYSQQYKVDQSYWQADVDLDSLELDRSEDEYPEEEDEEDEEEFEDGT